MDQEVKSLEELLDRIAEAESGDVEADEEESDEKEANEEESDDDSDEESDEESDDDQVSLDAILEAVGRRSFGPLLLLAGIITLMPIVGDIPGMPTMMGLLVILTTGQLLFRRERFWLPQWMLKRSITRGKLCKALGWMRRPTRFIDRITRPRLTPLVHGAGTVVIAVACIIIAAAMPAMEVVPFSANGAGAALTAFGLALIARDGLVALIAFIFTATTFGLVAYNLL